jgi:hypothetical protein
MSSDLSQIRKQTFGAAMETMKTPHAMCLAPGCCCEAEAIRAHSVQNATTLELLQRNGKVVAPKLNLSFANGSRMAFEEVGRNQATTFRGLCAEHDAEVFRPIEQSALDLSNPQHLFLLSYRAVLREAHATAKSARDTQAGYRAGVKNGLFPSEPCAPGMLAVEHISLAYMTHEHKSRYDVAYVAGAWQAVHHYQRDLMVPPGVAVNALLSTGRWSGETDSLAYATLNILPINGSTILLASSLAEHSRDFARSFKRFLNSGYILEKLSYLILKRCENFVLSPVLYDTFSERQKVECLMHFERNIGDNDWEPRDLRLINLFTRV